MKQNTRFFLIHFLLVSAGCLLLMQTTLYSDDWPTYQHDYFRSAVSKEQPILPLYEQWRFQALYEPQPAWPGPAKTDYWHRKLDLKARVTYDHAFHPIVTESSVFFASSADDRVYCLDAATGAERWSFMTEGPVRLAPTYYKGNLYFGSDDGKAYCLQAQTGQLLWKWQRQSPERMIPGNERIISNHPLRTGMIVEQNHCYFFTGLFPDEGVEWYDLDPISGAVQQVYSNLDISPQGYLLTCKDKLYVPTGRTAPVIFNKTGELVGKLKDPGGSFALLNDETLIHGPGDMGDLQADKKIGQAPLVTYTGDQVLIDGPISFLRSDSQITAVYRGKFQDIYQDNKALRKERNKVAERLWDLRERRKIKPEPSVVEIDRQIDKAINRLTVLDHALQQMQNNGLKWQKQIRGTCAMILAGNVLFVSSANTILALSVDTGQELWKNSIMGKGLGLAMAHGQLIVSTDRGAMHCFSASALAKPVLVQQQKKTMPFPHDPAMQESDSLAENILRESGIHKGYCLVLGSGDGRLAYSLAQKSELTVIGVEDNAEQVAAARRLLHATGLYGKRISIYQSALDKLPFSDYLANLIVSERTWVRGDLPTPPREVLRVLRPFGGQAIISFKQDHNNWLAEAKQNGWQISQDQYAWAKLTRDALPGSGEWTHLYADAANTSCSNDPLQGPMQIQWFGRPGPRDITNRHSRPMSPLFKNGRIFVPADNKIITVDAYNGTPLWELDVPQSRRVGALKDCGQMAVIDEEVYIAVQESCWKIDVKTGHVLAKFTAPQLIQGERREWGYVATVGDQLFGSGKIPGASFSEPARLNCDQLEGDFREMITSHYLFSCDRHTGEKKWTWQNGIILNNTIAIADGHVYLIESRNDKARRDVDGRLRVDYFCEGENYLVKLNQYTGEKIWEKPFHFPYSQIMYLSYAKNLLLVVGSYNIDANVHYGLYAFDAQDGEKKWENSYKGDRIGGEHGEQWQHPVIIGDLIYQRPYSFDLQTGEKGHFTLHRGGGGCGGLSGSTHYLYGRGSNPRMYELTERETSGTPLTRVNRPGCWINIIAAGGLVMIPESSSGCTCAYPVQTSFVFVPGT